MTLNFDPFPFLTTPRLVLRAITPADDQDLFLLRSDDRVMRYLDRPRAKSVEDVQVLINTIMEMTAKNEAVTWGISPANAPSRLIGTIGYWRIVQEHFRAEIGYMLNADFHGQGLMQEAMEEVIRYGFQKMKLHSIEANVNPNNLASINLLKRNRFVQEAYFKENYYYDGRFTDSAIYSLLNKEDH